MLKTTSLDTWISTPSGRQYEWDFHPSWAVRTHSSDHPTLELGCAVGHAQSPAHLPLHWLCASLPADAASDWTWCRTLALLSSIM